MGAHSIENADVAILEILQLAGWKLGPSNGTLETAVVTRSTPLEQNMHPESTAKCPKVREDVAASQAEPFCMMKQLPKFADCEGTVEV